MRIALVRQRYTAFGGAERFVERALEVLGTRGLELSVIAREWTGDPSGVIRCDPFYLGRLWRDWSFARAVCRETARHRFDLVQSHERIACCDVYRAGDGVHAQWLRNRRTFVGPLARLGLALNPYHAYLLSTERRLFASERLRAVICNSRMVRDEIRAWFGTSEDKLHVIYNGVDTETFHPRLRGAHRDAVRRDFRIPPGAPLHLFVGNGFERKGALRLIEALARARRRDAHVAIVGRDRDEARAARLAESLGVADRVRLVGAVQDVRPWYGAADSFVLPSLYDPFPNAALEAMACGLPVVVTPFCGTAELIEDAASGFVVDALAIEAIAEKLDRLDIRAAQAMGSRARAIAEGLDLQAMAGQLVALYQNLLRRS